MNILLWNLNYKQAARQVAHLARNEDVDILLLLECRVSPDVMLSTLRRLTGKSFYFVPTNGNRMGVYTRFPRRYVTLERPSVEQRRSLFLRLQLPGQLDILLVLVHGPSKWTNDAEDQGLFYDRLARSILAMEARKTGHRRTVVAGDFNANPFEPAIAGVRGLHGVMTPSLAKKPPRKVQGSRYPAFYNPMWSLYGRDEPPATYYHKSSKAHHLHWHMLDQVLVRPELIPRLSPGNVRILTKAGREPLLTPGGHPRISDHLPLFFRLDLKQGALYAV